jgi:hypothetical protein
MAECAYCKAKTFLCDGGVSICLKCADERDAKRKPPQIERSVRTSLLQEFMEASARSDAAREAFTTVMGEVPSSLPHPDGTQRIHNASRELSAARKEMMKTHARLDDFVSRGITSAFCV